MTDYRTMYDKDYIGAWDLKGDTVVTIVDVQARKIKNVQTNKEDKKPIITLDGFEKRWVCNLTNGATIAGLYGAHVEKWRGKSVTLYPAQVQAFGRMQDCIRVRPQVPAGAKRNATEHQLTLRKRDGSTQEFPKAGEWLTAFEAAIKDTPPQETVELWDLNSDAFYAIQEAMQRGENATGIERCSAVGKFAHERMAGAST